MYLDWAHSFKCIFFYIQKHLNHDMPFDPQVDRDLIDSIDQMYYEDKSFDPGLHEIEVTYTHMAMNNSAWIKLYTMIHN